MRIVMVTVSTSKRCAVPVRNVVLSAAPPARSAIGAAPAGVDRIGQPRYGPRVVYEVTGLLGGPIESARQGCTQCIRDRWIEPTGLEDQLPRSVELEAASAE